MSLREPEAKEAWRNLDDVATESVKSSLFSKWDFGAGDIVKNSFNIVKVSFFLHQLLNDASSSVSVWLLRSPRTEELA